MVYSGEPLPPEVNLKRSRQLNEIIAKGLIREKGIDTSCVNSWDEFISFFADDLSPENRP
jgi:transcriptional regulator of met regulon